MATVAGIYHLDRQIRCPAQSQGSLHRYGWFPDTDCRSKPVAKRLWASLEKPMKAVIEAGFEEGVRVIPAPSRMGGLGGW